MRYHPRERHRQVKNYQPIYHRFESSNLCPSAVAYLERRDASFARSSSFAQQIGVLSLPAREPPANAGGGELTHQRIPNGTVQISERQEGVER